ncbi:MAG: DciA family protein [Deferribacterota bacterium]|nr:DciA family protein [Deferribacterota bacterium]
MEIISSILKKNLNCFKNNISNLLIISSIWDVLVDGCFSQISKPIKVTGNRLIVGVLDNIVLQELSFMHDEIVSRLQKRGFKINKISFKVINYFDIDKNETVEEDIEVDLRGYEYIYDSIENDNIRESFKRAFSAYIKNLKKN